MVNVPYVCTRTKSWAKPKSKFKSFWGQCEYERGTRRNNMCHSFSNTRRPTTHTLSFDSKNKKLDLKSFEAPKNEFIW